MSKTLNKLIHKSTHNSLGEGTRILNIGADTLKKIKDEHTAETLPLVEALKEIAKNGGYESSVIARKALEGVGL